MVGIAKNGNIRRPLGGLIYTARNLHLQTKIDPVKPLSVSQKAASEGVFGNSL